MSLTVGDLKKQLAHYDDDVEITFNGLDFYRLKMRGENLVQIEFNQTVYKNTETGKVEVIN
ncbi:hypothetical protein H5087_09055 [Pseudoalteromonas sp. SR43-7]|uniref:hypothetical protein n=1 Tax=Pseudoalteromonas sp. SR43-7 TaxID=2760939 RepID=UPI0015F8C670|nr:hypothetical protein [Pseudoalteromonas sp. SR43-7]MBB1329494.1 hypothetical protein [Pseudoalteromonas sp. SR43-7]